MNSTQKITLDAVIDLITSRIRVMEYARASLPPGASSGWYDTKLDELAILTAKIEAMKTDGSLSVSRGLREGSTRRNMKETPVGFRPVGPPPPGSLVLCTCRNYRRGSCPVHGGRS